MAMALRGSSFPRPPRKARDTHEKNFTVAPSHSTGHGTGAHWHSVVRRKNFTTKNFHFSQQRIAQPNNINNTTEGGHEELDREVSDYELEGEEDDQPDEMTVDSGEGRPANAADGEPPDGVDGSGDESDGQDGSARVWGGAGGPRGARGGRMPRRAAVRAQRTART